MVDHLIGAVRLGAAALSLEATIAGAAGLALLLLAAWLPLIAPAVVRHGLAAAGLCLLVGGALYQSGRIKGVQLATELAAQKAVAAEAERARLAEDVRDRIAAQATADLAAEREANQKLQELNDALAKDRDRDRPCLDRDSARRLRDL